MRKLIGIVVFACMVVFFSSRFSFVKQSYATGVTNAFQDTVIVPAGQVIEGDYNALGNSVTIAGTITGNAHIIAKNVTITGKINGDLMVSGTNVNLIGATIGGQVHAMGTNVNTDQNTKIGGDIKAAGTNVTVNGDVKNGAKIYGDQNATIGGGLRGDMKVLTGGVLRAIFENIGNSINNMFKTLGGQLHGLFEISNQKTKVI